MISIRTERPVNAAAREALLDVAYGQVRNQKPSARLRKGRLPADGLSLVAVERDRIVGTVRLWHVDAGRGHPALLLGPLAVHPGMRQRGIGASLVRRAVETATRLGHRAVLLVGDASYYGRFGFSAEKTGMLTLPGADPARLLALELASEALNAAQGRIAATGKREPIPALAALAPVAPLIGKRAVRLISRAA
jgi:predicted N-acetyltransferase YhbS